MGTGSGPSPPSPDLVSACIAWLRTNDSGSVATTFGDAPTTPKFFEGRGFVADAPYLIFEESQATEDEYSTGGNYIASGSIIVHTFSANGQRDAKALAELVRGSLNNAPLVYTGEKLMRLWSNARSVPVPGDSTPGAPALFQRVFSLEFMASGQIVLP
jgi:hypothetical protein